MGTSDEMAASKSAHADQKLLASIALLVRGEITAALDREREEIAKHLEKHAWHEDAEIAEQSVLEGAAAYIRSRKSTPTGEQS